ncbi:GreA/GreB family elongation factor [Imbroritus primus]|uniref:GreA/GreB family elongation factor n=1 Tax=Imbroritus primus TaxID=3058603 RepID=UPI003D160F88
MLYMSLEKYVQTVTIRGVGPDQSWARFSAMYPPPLISNREAAHLRATADTLRGERRGRLLRFLDSADIVDAAAVPPEVIATGVSFLCLDTSCNALVRLMLVPEGQADLATGHICVTSPMGLPFLGRRRGEIVTCPTLVGVEMAFEIVEVPAPLAVDSGS